MTRVLITGATGFVGKPLAKELRERGYDVVGTSLRCDGENLLRCDLLDVERVKEVVETVRPEVIYHCAAIASTTHSSTIDYYSHNVVGTKNLLSAIKTLERRPRFLFLSTAGVYGNQAVELLDETLRPMPVHDYGMSKLCAELWVSQSAEFCDPTIFRPFNIVGPGQNEFFIFPKLAAAFASAQTRLRLGNLDVFRDYLDIKSFCATLADFIDCEASFQQTVNLCSGRATSLREMIAAFEEIAGYKIEVINAPEFTRSNEVWRLVGSRDKLDRLVPNSIQAAPVDVMVRDMYEYYKG